MNERERIRLGLQLVELLIDERDYDTDSCEERVNILAQLDYCVVCGRIDKGLCQCWNDN